MKLTWILAASLALAAPAMAEAQPIEVVASFSILADMARAVGGDEVRVTSLVPPDGDAHTYEPRPADLMALRSARVLVVNGLGLEGWMDRLAAAAGGDARRVVASAGVKARSFTEDGRTVPDPHAWQDPRNGEIYARNIAAGLAAADPAHAGIYRARAERYAAEIGETDAWIAATLGRIPPKRRRIITSHDAFFYYGARYGIDFVGVQGIDTEAEPTARDIARLSGQIRRDGIRVVFVENMTDPRLAATLAKESGAVVGPKVYSDALSPEGGPAASYLTMLRHNTEAFAAALSAP